MRARTFIAGGASLWPRGTARRLRRDRNGAVALLIGLLLVPLLLTAGLAVDLSRAYMVQSRLMTATDAAALTAAREFYSPTRDARAAGFFWSNFGRVDPARPVGYLDSVVDGPRFTVVNGTEIEVSATAAMPTLLMRAFGYETIDISARNLAQRAERGMELALVIDVSSTMKGEKLKTLRNAALTMTGTLFGPRETSENLWVSVVPYAAAVNLGPSRLAWLRVGSLDPSDYLPKMWKGCVEARHQNGNDGNDLNPFQAPFDPYLYRPTLNKYTKHEDDDGKGKAHGYVKGDNDWSLLNVTEDDHVKLGEDAVGPNLACPPPVLPLTRSKADVHSFINSLEAHARGGRMANLGLQAAWFSISPRWRGLWGEVRMPLDYGTPGFDKVVILVAGGENVWYDWPKGAPGHGPSGWGDDGDADYTAYGRLKEDRLALAPGINDEAQAGKEIDRRMEAICTVMKSQEIIIYTMTYGITSNAVKTRYRNCASHSGLYFDSPNDKALESAFREIADDLMSVRLQR